MFFGISHSWVVTNMSFPFTKTNEPKCVPRWQWSRAQSKPVSFSEPGPQPLRTPLVLNELQHSTPDLLSDISAWNHHCCCSQINKNPHSCSPELRRNPSQKSQDYYYNKEKVNLLWDFHQAHMGVIHNEHIYKLLTPQSKPEITVLKNFWKQHEVWSKC